MIWFWDDGEDAESLACWCLGPAVGSVAWTFNARHLAVQFAARRGIRIVEER
jgi:hypothetical protein